MTSDGDAWARLHRLEREVPAVMGGPFGPESLRVEVAASSDSPAFPVSDGSRVARLQIRGVRCSVVYRLDEQEHRRRSAAGLAAVTTLGWLDVLLGLPHGSTVPVAALTPTERRIIRRLPVGCVQTDNNGEVVRELVAPLEVDLVVVSARTWQNGLKAAAPFTNYCTRVLALADVPDDLPAARLHAELDGVGLVVNAATDPVTAVRAVPFVKLAHTPAGWRFSEQIYAQVHAQVDGG